MHDLTEANLEAVMATYAGEQLSMRAEYMIVPPGNERQYLRTQAWIAATRAARIAGYDRRKVKRLARKAWLKAGREPIPAEPIKWATIYYPPGWPDA